MMSTFQFQEGDTGRTPGRMDIEGWYILCHTRVTFGGLTTEMGIVYGPSSLDSCCLSTSLGMSGLGSWD